MDTNEPHYKVSVASCTVGFLVSVLLTAAAYFTVTEQLFAKKTTVIVIGIFAFLQAVAQLLFFLHLGQEGKPRWQTLTFFSMVTVLSILIIGSLWIMYNLNYRMMN